MFYIIFILTSSFYPSGSSYSALVLLLLFADLDLPTSLSNQFIRPKPLTQVRAITSHHVLVRAQLITEVGARHTCLPIYFIIYTSSNNTKSELAAHFIVG
jgi:hypothetical protein